MFVRELEFLEELQEDMKSNQIFLDGYICKEPIYRKTPLGREIADLLIAVKPFLRKIRLYTVYLLGEKCEICFRL